MRGKPIGFSAPMVKAILEGRKTQERRVVRPQPTVADAVRCCNGVYEFSNETFTGTIQGRRPAHACGDILWVREEWREHSGYGCGYIYKANYLGEITETALNWKPSTHMPREAARIFLRVTDVGVERLQDIGESDAESEGAEDVRTPLNTFYMDGHKFGFWGLWDSLNAERGYGWDTNPWVWVYEFERVMIDG